MRPNFTPHRPYHGRADDMLILKGVISTHADRKIIMGIPEVGQNYLIELIKEGLMDQIRVKVEIKEEYFIEDMRALQGIQKKIAGMLRDEILITPE